MQFIDKLNENDKYKHSVVIISCAILMFECFIIYPNNLLSLIVASNNNDIDNNNDDIDIAFFWVYSIILGFFTSILFMTLEAFIIQIQPKHISGKIQGLKLCLNFICEAISASIVGILWNYSIEYIWYVPAISFSITICLSIFIALTQTYIINR